MKTRFFMIAVAATMLGTAAAQARDVASGVPTGKRIAKQSLRAPAKTVASPRDAASGLPTGKRQHKPVVKGTLSVVSPRDLADAQPAAKARQQINRSKSNVKNNN